MVRFGSCFIFFRFSNGCKGRLFAVVFLPAGVNTIEAKHDIYVFKSRETGGNERHVSAFYVHSCLYSLDVFGGAFSPRGRQAPRRFISTCCPCAGNGGGGGGLAYATACELVLGQHQVGCPSRNAEHLYVCNICRVSATTNRQEKKKEKVWGVTSIWV